jgi:hypothetical protein
MRLVIDMVVDDENPKELFYVAKVEEVERWEGGIKKYNKMHKCILVDRFDSVTDDEESDNDNDEKESESETNVKGKGIRFSGSSRATRYSISSIEENYAERLENRMREIQDDIKNRMKDLEDTLKKLLESKS